MKVQITNVMTWAARILGIVTPIMIGDYLLKSEKFNFPLTGFYLLDYPAIIEIFVFCFLLILAWRWPVAGGILYLLIWPLFYFVIAFERSWNSPGVGPSLLSTIPPLLAGVLFLVSGLINRARRKKAASSSHTPAG